MSFGGGREEGLKKENGFALRRMFRMVRGLGFKFQQKEGRRVEDGFVLSSNCEFRWRED